ncbi:hypothetical protein [Actinomadura sp. 3N508]|uniref:hypothetical protein n=1 Tax=Actinomadura sp. 3N508 TaxID=3375153 RepID=UPI0037B80C11
MINMAVRGDSGAVIARARCGLPWTNELGGLDPAAFPMLTALLPYADAVFNERQIPVLLKELDRLPDEVGGDWVEETRELCAIALQAPHRYLWFLGD